MFCFFPSIFYHPTNIQLIVVDLNLSGSQRKVSAPQTPLKHNFVVLLGAFANTSLTVSRLISPHDSAVCIVSDNAAKCGGLYTGFFFFFYHYYCCEACLFHFNLFHLEFCGRHHQVLCRQYGRIYPAVCLTANNQSRPDCLTTFGKQIINAAAS